MLGVVLISHGEMAKGMLSSAGMFFGESGLEQVTTVSLMPENGAEEFDVMLANAISEVDSGDGVVVLADLLGGTPCNRSIFIANDKVQVISGVNFPLFMELLGLRLGGEVDFDALVSTGKEGIMNINKLLNEQ